MKIIVDDPKLGRFEWQFNPKLENQFSSMGKILRGKMNLPEQIATEAEQAMIEDIKSLINTFLHLISGVMFMGGPQGLFIHKMLKSSLNEVSSTALQILEADRS